MTYSMARVVSTTFCILMEVLGRRSLLESALYERDTFRGRNVTDYRLFIA